MRVAEARASKRQGLLWASYAVLFLHYTRISTSIQHLRILRHQYQLVVLFVLFIDYPCPKEVLLAAGANPSELAPGRERIVLSVGSRTKNTSPI